MNEPNQDEHSDAFVFHEEWLTAYLDGELTDVQKQLVDERLATDAGARQLLEELRHVRTLVAAIPTWAAAVGSFQPIRSNQLGDLDDGLSPSDSAQRLAPGREPSSPAASDTDRSAEHQLAKGSPALPSTVSSRSVWSRLALAACALFAIGIGLALWQGGPAKPAAVGQAPRLSPAQRVDDAVENGTQMEASPVDSMSMASDVELQTVPPRAPSLSRSAPGNAIPPDSDMAQAKAAPDAIPFAVPPADTPASAPPESMAMDSMLLMEVDATEQATAPEQAVSRRLIAYDANWTKEAIEDQLLINPALSELQALSSTSPLADASRAMRREAAASAPADVEEKPEDSTIEQQLARLDLATYAPELAASRVSELTNNDRPADSVFAGEAEGAGLAKSSQPYADKQVESQEVPLAGEQSPQSIMLFVSTSAVESLQQQFGNRFHIEVLDPVVVDTAASEPNLQRRILVLTPLTAQR